MSKVFGVYLPYHKGDILDPTDGEYAQLPDFPKEFRRVRIYKTGQEQMSAFANIMCPASQTFECDETEIDATVADLDNKFANDAWLDEYVYPYI